MFSYLKENFFFDLPQDRKEEIDRLLSEKLSVNEIKSSILSHNSIYNKKPIHETLSAYLPKMYRFCYYEQFLFWLKDYFGIYKDTNSLIMKDIAYLSPQYKYYIAIMVVSTMKSQYLLKMVEEQFLEEGGDETWLIAGLNAVPKKLQVLSLLVNILSHQPWKVSSEELKGLKSYWTLPELAEVAVVVVHYNKLCIIEESLNIRKNVVLVETSFDNGVDDSTQESLMKQIEEIENEERDSLNSDNAKKVNKFDKNEIKQESFQSAGEVDNKEELKAINEMFNKHISSENSKYIFQNSDKEKTCTFLEYNWDDSKYVLSNYLPKQIPLLDKEIKYIVNLQYEESNVPNSLNLSPRHNLLKSPQIKRAVCNYIEKIFGYYHEDYNYSNITKLFGNKSHTRKFIKKIACFPYNVQLSDIEELNKTFKHEEIMHLIALVAVIKSRVQLVYMIRALSDVIKSID